jgi:hypothetical protein
MGVIGSGRTNVAWRPLVARQIGISGFAGETQKPPGRMSRGRGLRVRRGSRREGDDFDRYRHPTTNLERTIAWLTFQI